MTPSCRRAPLRWRSDTGRRSPTPCGVAIESGAFTPRFDVDGDVEVVVANIVGLLYPVWSRGAWPAWRRKTVAKYWLEPNPHA